MKKFFVFTICIFALLGTLFVPNLAPIFASAETFVTSKLEYFELDKPLSVDRDGDRVFIAQKDLIVVYRDQTYDKIEVAGGDITHIEKCGDYLLFLNASKLFALNLSTYEISNALFSDVQAFSVNGLQFAINSNNAVQFFEISNGGNLSLTQLKPAYKDSFSVPILDGSSVIALAPNLTFYYYAFSLVNDIDENGRQGNTFTQTIDGLSQFYYTDSQLFFKTDKTIYSYQFESKILLPILNLADHGITSEGGFCVNGTKILICDTQNDRVVEYNISTSSLTGFEISFTKIDLPRDFHLDYSGLPKYITINKGDRLYDIDLAKSIENDYFLFKGYHNQEIQEDYLLIKEISNSFYLVAGDCFALVLKEDYTPRAVPASNCEKIGYFTNSANCYTYPILSKEFLSFRVEKHAPVRIVQTLSFNGIDYSIVNLNNKFAFIPSSFILDKIYTPDEYNDYHTATTIKRAVSVYSDKNLAEVVDSLPKFSDIAIISEETNCYYISYNQGKAFGYIAKNSIATKGSYTNRNVFVIILVAISVTITAIFLLLKYLYKPKKKL